MCTECGRWVCPTHSGLRDRLLCTDCLGRHAAIVIAQRQEAEAKQQASEQQQHAADLARLAQASDEFTRLIRSGARPPHTIRHSEAVPYKKSFGVVKRPPPKCPLNHPGCVRVEKPSRYPNSAIYETPGWELAVNGGKGDYVGRGIYGSDGRKLDFPIVIFVLCDATAIRAEGKHLVTTLGRPGLSELAPGTPFLDLIPLLTAASLTVQIEGFISQATS